MKVLNNITKATSNSLVQDLGKQESVWRVQQILQT